MRNIRFDNFSAEGRVWLAVRHFHMTACDGRLAIGGSGLPSDVHHDGIVCVVPGLHETRAMVHGIDSVVVVTGYD